MNARIERLPAKTLVGMKVRTSVSADVPVTYWRPFKMRLNEIQNALTERFYSVQVYDGLSLDEITPHTEFEKWAAVEVSNLNKVPDEMDSLIVPEGLYAIFVHIGTPTSFPETLRQIFFEWLPRSSYVLDNRPHLAMMESSYQLDDVNAEELVCVPIKNKPS